MFRIVQNFFLQLLGFLFPHNHILIDPINELINNLRESGLIDHWVNKKYIATKARDEPGPEVLVKDHLAFGYHVYIIPLVIGFVGFLIELLVPISEFWRFFLKFRNGFE